MTTVQHHPSSIPPNALTPSPSLAELGSTLTDFCLDLMNRCDGHAFVQGSPALETLSIYAYGAVHTLADRYRFSATKRHMLAAKLYVEFFGLNGALALANAYALAGAARHPESPRYAVIQGSAAVFRDWQRNPALLNAGDFRAHLTWPDAA